MVKRHFSGAKNKDPRLGVSGMANYEDGAFLSQFSLKIFVKATFEITWQTNYGFAHKGLIK